MARKQQTDGQIGMDSLPERVPGTATQPVVWHYSWLGGEIGDGGARPDSITVVQPLSRDERPWAEAWADRIARGLPPVHVSALHQHVPGCWVDPTTGTTYDALSLKLDGSGVVMRLCFGTQHFTAIRLATPREISASLEGTGLPRV